MAATAVVLLGLLSLFPLIWGQCCTRPWQAVTPGLCLLASPAEVAVRWPAAQAFCVSEGGNLATFSNMTKAQHGHRFARTSFGLPNAVWLGLIRARGSQQFKNTTGQRIRWQPWKNGYPNILINEEACGYFYIQLTRFMLLDEKCTRFGRPFLCRKPWTSRCPDTTLTSHLPCTPPWIQLNRNTCIFSSTLTGPWTAAKEFCREKGGHMVTGRQMMQVENFLNETMSAALEMIPILPVPMVWLAEDSVEDERRRSSRMPCPIAVFGVRVHYVRYRCSYSFMFLCEKRATILPLP